MPPMRTHRPARPSSTASSRLAAATDWSLPPSATQSVIFAPEVTDVAVETGETSVALSWHVHPATDAVVAVRAEGRPPQGLEDGTAVEASLAGLTDSGLRTGDRVLLPDHGVIPYTRAGQRRVRGRNRRAGGARARARGSHAPGGAGIGQRQRGPRGRLGAATARPGAPGAERQATEVASRHRDSRRGSGRAPPGSRVPRRGADGRDYSSSACRRAATTSSHSPPAAAPSWSAIRRRSTWPSRSATYRPCGCTMPCG